MNFEKDIEELSKKIENNTKEIKQNLDKIINNEYKIDNNFEKIQQNSYALDILKDYKNESKRLFTILIIVLFMWFLTIGYLVYVLNDINYEETITETYDIEQQSEDNGSNNFINGNNNEVNN